MRTIKPDRGVNLRVDPFNCPDTQWALMQNYDYDDDDIFRMINGSTRYHGTSLGTNSANAIIPYYNNENGDNHVLSFVDQKIVRKNDGSNEFVDVLTGLGESRFLFSVNVKNREYLAHPEGLIEYDGVAATVLNDGPKLSDIVYSRETNRCFGISATDPNVIEFTDDLATTGGLPILWNPLNLQFNPQTEGDKIERLAMLDVE